MTRPRIGFELVRLDVGTCFGARRGGAATARARDVRSPAARSERRTSGRATGR
jgi:hypothetical protein